MPGILHTYKQASQQGLSYYSHFIGKTCGVKRNYSLLSLARVKAQILSSAMKLKTTPEKRLENGMHPASQSLFLKLECVFGNLSINHVCLKSGGLSYVTLCVDISVMK